MRLTLDIYAERVRANSGPSSEPLSRLDVPLGSAGVELTLLDHAAALVPASVHPARIEFSVVSAFGEAPLVSGYKDIEELEDAAETITFIGEDWYAAGLVALFGDNPRSVDLIGQFRWRSGTEAIAASHFHFSQSFKVRVLNTLLPSAYIPGGVAVGNNLYLSTITDYAGGDSTDLDSVEIDTLPLNTVIRMVHATNGESAWQVRAGTTPTDVETGIIRPVNSTTRNLVRVSGSSE